MLVSNTKTSPTLVNGQGYLDFSKNGEKVNHAVVYVDTSANASSKYFTHVSHNIVGSNMVYYSVFTGTFEDISIGNWKNATTADLNGKKVVIIADVT